MVPVAFRYTCHDSLTSEAALLKSPAHLLVNALKPHADLQHSDSKEKTNPAEKTIVAYCCVRVFAFRVGFCHYWSTIF